MEEELNDEITFDDSNILDDGEDEQKDEIPHNQRHLQTQPYDKSIGDLVSMIKNGDIILNPEYQRNYVWDDKRASLLIESVLLNVPIPVIYVSEEDDGKWTVVDGLQRLNSLNRYFDNEFGLRGLEIISELNKVKYKDLNPKAARLLRNGTIRVILILKESHHEIKYDIFMRLNRGSVKLTEQELRNCLYRGAFNDLLLELREKPTFLKAIGRPRPHKRMADAEMILRFFMLQEGFDIKDNSLSLYTGNMKASLNKYTSSKKNTSNEEIERMKSIFANAISNVETVFGANSFRRFTDDETYDERLNRAVVDVQMVVLSSLSAGNIQANKDAIALAYEDLCKNSDFIDSVLVRTSNKSKTQLRLSLFNRAVSKFRS